MDGSEVEFLSEDANTCASWYGRWMEAKCYCEVGSFYTLGWPGDSSDVPTIMVNCTHTDENCCPVYPGIDGTTWNGWYIGFSIFELVVFSIFLAWCVLQLIRMFRKSQVDKIQAAVHGLALTAIALRISFIAVEYYAVEHYDPLQSVGNQTNAYRISSALSPILYSSFFPLAACIFLCIYHYWLRFIAAVEEAEGGIRGTISTWRSPLRAVPILLIVEVIRDLVCIIGEVYNTEQAYNIVQMFNGCYFVWLALVSLVVAFSGLVVAQKLRLRVNAWLPFLSQSSLSKVQVCTVTISITAVLFLFLNIVESVIGRFSAWPYLICRMVGAPLVVIYLFVIFTVAGRVQQTLANNRSLEMPSGNSDASFAGSFVSNASFADFDRDFDAEYVAGGNSGSTS